MAIIYSYPSATPTTSDVVIGTLLSDDSGENPTKSFSIADIIGLVPAAGTGGTVTSIGLTNTDGFLTIGNSPITTAGNIGIDIGVQCLYGVNASRSAKVSIFVDVHTIETQMVCHLIYLLVL